MRSNQSTLPALLLPITLVGVIYVAVATLVGSAVVGEYLLSAASLVPPFAGLVLGGVGAWGVSVGVLLTDALRGTVDLLTLFRVVGAFLFTYISGRLFHEMSVPVGYDADSDAIARYVLAVTAGATAAAATLGWGYELLAHAPFVAAGRLAIELLALPVAVGAPLFALFRGVGGDSDRWPGGGVQDADGGESDPRSVALRLAVAPSAWLVGGIVWYAGYGAFETVVIEAPGALVSRGFGFLIPLYRPSVFGPAGARVQAAIGAVMFLVVVTPVLRSMKRYVLSQQEVRSATDKA